MCVSNPAPRDESAGDSIAHALRDDILAGRLQPGTRLVEDTIAKQFGVSRIPVREALTRLQSEGFVSIIRHRGATVSTTLIKDSRELLQIRRGLESLAAQLAAANRGGAVAAELAGIAAGTDDHETPFHELVAQASGNQQLAELLSSVNRRVNWGLGNNPDASVGDHRILAMAIVNGSTTQAGYLMDEHLLRDERYFDEMFDTDNDR
ncbi:GntR family transcriptional regulator [Mycobacterium sp. C31M]